MSSQKFSDVFIHNTVTVDDNVSIGRRIVKFGISSNIQKNTIIGAHCTQSECKCQPQCKNRELL